MTDNSQFTVQLLEKIGGPLASAINQVVSEGDDAEVKAAKIMVQLLARTTQMSTMLYNALEIKENEDQADSTRLALAALAAPLIVKFYTQREQVPTEDNVNTIGKSLEALVSFGENFSPAADHKSRLQTIGHDIVFFDNDQPSLVILQAMVPVINAVEEFSFGQSKVKMVQNIAAQLEKNATEISKKTGSTDKLKELIIFKALAALYASCHRAETQRASSGDDAAREALSLDPVWESFTTKVAMIDALMGYEERAVDSGGNKAPEPAQETTQDSVPASVEEKPKTEAPSSPATAGGPMGFFKKGPEGDSGEQDASPVTPAASVEKVEMPAASPPPATEESKTQESEAPSSSPMGFFKPGAKKEEAGKE